MNYYEELRHYRLINLRTQLKSPTLVRIDINLPVIGGKISENNMRLQVYAHLLEIYSEYAGLVLMGHQGRPGGKDFIPLKQHWIQLRKMLPADVDVEYVPKDEVFKPETRERIGKLREREIILLDNMRYFPEETKFDHSTSGYLQFFKGVVKTCINDAMPVWHRDNASLMCLPYLAPTYIGMRSSYELKILDEVISKKEGKALIMGGSKLQKISYLMKILETTEGFTGGLPSQMILRAKGQDLGPENNKLLESKFSFKEFEEARTLCNKYDVACPVDFTVFEEGENQNIELKDMRKTNGIIMDIGEATLEKYAERLQEKEVRIRAGPLGVYEKGYTNGIELTKRIAGEGLIFLGGDTSQEVVSHGIDSHIRDAGGQILISGGSFLHGMAGEPFPSLDLMLKLSKPR